jgi:hypothetical protein
MKPGPYGPFPYSPIIRRPPLEWLSSICRRSELLPKGIKGRLLFTDIFPPATGAADRERATDRSVRATTVTGAVMRPPTYVEILVGLLSQTHRSVFRLRLAHRDEENDSFPHWLGKVALLKNGQKQFVPTSERISFAATPPTRDSDLSPTWALRVSTWAINPATSSAD